MDKSLIQSVVAGSVSASYGLAVYRLARHGRLTFRYAVGWLFLCLLGIFSGLLALVITPISTFLGITPTAVIGIGATILFIGLSIQLSVSISGIQQQNRRLAESLAEIRSSTSQKVQEGVGQQNHLDRSNVLVVVPAFNEQKNIGNVLTGLVAHQFQVVVVDDGSHDDTSEVASLFDVNVLTLPFNLGVGGALRAGFRYATHHSFQAVVQVDADGQHSSSEIDSLINEANSSRAHLVLGSRFKAAGTSMTVSPIRRLAMKYLAKSASHACKSEITDATSGFRLIREPLLSQFAGNFPTNYLGDTYEALVSAGRANYVIKEIPTAMHERNDGTSSASTLQAATLTLKALMVANLRINCRIAQHDQVSSKVLQKPREN